MTAPVKESHYQPLLEEHEKYLSNIFIDSSYKKALLGFEFYDLPIPLDCVSDKRIIDWNCTLLVGGVYVEFEERNPSSISRTDSLLDVRSYSLLFNGENSVDIDIEFLLTDDYKLQIRNYLFQIDWYKLIVLYGRPIDCIDNF